MLDYVVLEDFLPYQDAFLFHIFKNNDRIELSEQHTTIVVWIHRIEAGYADKGIRDRLRLEFQRDDLKLKENFGVLKNILSQEVIGFTEFDFSAEDILYCI